MAVVRNPAEHDVERAPAQYHYRRHGSYRAVRRDDELAGSQEETEITVYACRSVAGYEGLVWISDRLALEVGSRKIEVRSGACSWRDQGGCRPAFEIEECAGRGGGGKDVVVIVSIISPSSSCCAQQQRAGD